LLFAPAIIIVNFLNNISEIFNSVKDLEGVTYREINSFDPEWDSYWEECLNDFAINFRRQSDTLNYKYFTRQDVKHNVILFEKDGNPVGYGVYRLSVNDVRNIRLGRIVDIVFDAKLSIDLLKQIIKTMKQRLQKENIDGIVAVAANDEIKKAYQKNGIYLSRMQPAIIKEEDFMIDDLRSKYKYLWYITLGDSDLDNYW
jgi:hypothetical protein